MSGLPKIDLLSGWDCYDWRNARTILEYSHTSEWSELNDILTPFRLLHSDLKMKGGGKTAVSGAIDSAFYAKGWVEREFKTAILVDGEKSDSPTHSVDCFKGKIALEVEWNNKDPFYDRDLNNFRLLYELRIADVGIIITRATSLQIWLNERYKDFDKAPGTFGKSATHFDKLEPKILGGGAGGCPVLVLAMTPELYSDDRDGGQAG